MELVKPVIACLPGRGLCAETEPLLMIRPPRGGCARMIRTA